MKNVRKYNTRREWRVALTRRESLVRTEEEGYLFKKLAIHHSRFTKNVREYHCSTQVATALRRREWLVETEEPAIPV